MGIKETDDYLTVRFANPETGLVSPSACGGVTPRTPITPGEALRLYADSSGSPRLAAKRPYGLRSRSPHNLPNPSWNQELEHHVALQQAPSANSSAVIFRAEPGHPPPDQAPAERLSDPFTSQQEIEMQGGRKLAQPAAHRIIQNRPARRNDGRADDGVLRFSLASHALKSCNDAQRPRLQRRVTAIRHATGEMHRHRPSTTKQAFHAHERHTTGGAQVVGLSMMVPVDESKEGPATTALHVTENAANLNIRPDSIPDELMRVPRKPVGSPPVYRGTHEPGIARDTPVTPVFGQTTACRTAKSSEDRDRDSSAHAHRLNKSGKLQDELDRPLPPPHLQRVYRTPASDDAFSMGAAHPGAVLRHADKIWNALLVLSTPFTVARQQCTFEMISTLLPALDTLSDDAAEPADRLAALRTLLASIGRAIILITAVIMIWRICVAVKDLLDILFWPLSLLGGLVHVIFGW